jgi:hypothetical protein
VKVLEVLRLGKMCVTMSRHPPGPAGHSNGLQYACRYWVQHLQSSESSLADNGQVHVFLREHLLHWLEALSLIKKTSEGVLAIISLESLVIVRNSLSVLKLKSKLTYNSKG